MLVCLDSRGDAVDGGDGGGGVGEEEVEVVDGVVLGCAPTTLGAVLCGGRSTTVPTCIE